MKTKFFIIIVITILLFCCQQKDWTGPNENDIVIDSAESSGINNKMLNKWFSLSRESDSIIASAQLIIQKQREEVEFHPQDERQYISTCIAEAQEHVDQMQRKVKYIKEFALHIKTYDPSLQHKIDSLKEDYIQEELKLETALNQLK